MTAHSLAKEFPEINQGWHNCHVTGLRLFNPITAASVSVWCAWRSSGGLRAVETEQLQDGEAPSVEDAYFWRVSL